MFEAKLYKVRGIQEAPVQRVDETYEIPVRPDFLLVTQTVNAYPDQIGRVIQAVGPFQDGNEYFVPALTCSQTDRRGRFIPQSERVILSHLRETVVSLMDEETPPQTRNVFYHNNTIPGAIWNKLPDDSYILVNGNEIIPENYNSDSLRDDIDDYSRMHTWLQKKIPKYVRTGRLDYDGRGERSLLVSNNQNRIKIRDRRQGQTLRDYYSELKLEGNIYEFWSSRDLKKLEQLEGQMNLLGELPSLANYVYPYYVLRDERSSGWSYTTDYKGIKQIIYG
jgi:hypothetical protein